MHISVLLQPALESLRISANLTYIDCTFGGGGHSKAIADLGGKVLALDADPDAMDRLPVEYRDKITLVHSNFEHVEDVTKEKGLTNVAGVLFDLGLSSFHLADGQRGFAFMHEGPLDMRFDTHSSSHTAGLLIDVLPEEALAELFVKFGDEPHATKIAKIIKKNGPWQHKTTKNLADLIERSIGRVGKIHPATRVFQSLRMAVNDEVGVLERGLHGAQSVTVVGGRIVVISFHSIEDRIVKHTFKQWEDAGNGIQIGDVIVPSESEISQNPRARSAKMRVFEKYEYSKSHDTM